MRHLIISLLLVFPNLLAAQELWHQKYEEALSISKKESKYLLCVITGQNQSDQLPWYKKMQGEVLSQKVFIEKAQKNFVFFLSQKDLVDIQENDLNYPKIYLVDPQKGVIASLGYFSGTADEFVLYLEGVVADYKEILLSVRTPEVMDFEKLYHKIKRLGCNLFREQLSVRGMQAENRLFFLLEKYCSCLEGGMACSTELQELKKDIEGEDPKNIKGTHLKLAMIDFYTRSLNALGAAVAPLYHYVDEYGEKDRNNIWRLHMMLSQYLFTHGDKKQALEHARASFKTAPKVVHKEIAETISYLRGQIED